MIGTSTIGFDTLTELEMWILNRMMELGRTVQLAVEFLVAFEQWLSALIDAIIERTVNRALA